MEEVTKMLELTQGERGVFIVEFLFYRLVGKPYLGRYLFPAGSWIGLIRP